MLRDRFVCGLRSESIQKILLSAEDLSLSNVVAKAQSLETAHRNAQALKHSGSLPVSKVYGSSLTPKSFTRRASNEPQAAGRKPCHRCGKTGHTGQDCSFRDAICHRCGKKGHIAKVCLGGGKPHNTPKSGKKVTRWVGTEEPQDVPSGVNYSEDVLYNVYTLGPAKKNPYKIVTLNGREVPMEIDTGAAVSIISQATQKTHFPNAALATPRISLRTHTTKPIPVVGQMSVRVTYNGYVGNLTLYVVKGNGPSLLGRDWLEKIKIDWVGIKAVTSSDLKQEVETLLNKYPQICQPGLGTMTQMTAHLSFKPDIQPRFCRPRPVPYSIKEKVGKELDRLEATGVLRRVDHADSAAPIVPVPKRDGSIRICGDYKVTSNPSLQINQYPLPKPSDLMTCLTGGQQFSKLDLTAAYQQMKLDKESSKLVTINTH